VLEAAGKRFGFFLHVAEFQLELRNLSPHGSHDAGKMASISLRPFDAIFLGAVGHPMSPTTYRYGAC